MKPSRNDITGDFMLTGATSDAYRDGWDRIFGNKKKEEPPKKVEEKSKRKKEDYQKPKPTDLPTSAFFLQIVEYERGWGSKPDGYLCFLTEEAAKKYRDEQYKDRTGATPDYYVNYNDVGWLQINVAAATTLVNSDRGFLYMDDPYKKGS